MEWLAFLKCYFGMMICYYTVIILYDLFVGAKKVRPLDETEMAYDVQALLQDEGAPQHVAPGQVERLSDSQEDTQEQRYLERFELAKQPIPDAVGTHPQERTDEHISFRQPPQGQGIPLAEFIEKAKAMSREIAF